MNGFQFSARQKMHRGKLPMRGYRHNGGRVISRGATIKYVEQMTILRLELDPQKLQKVE